MTRQAARSRQQRGVLNRLDINLDDFEVFKNHALVTPFRGRYRREAALAQQAILQIVEDLEVVNQAYLDNHGRVALTSVYGRVKEEDSFFRKMLSACRERAKAQGVSQKTLEASFSDIKDLAGVRFSCPYFDEVIPTIDGLVRSDLLALGYGADLSNEVGFADKNYLEDGDTFGYRSYHFYVRIPTVVDIYETIEPCLCEVQARTELQHIWADKSHELMYKPSAGWDVPDEQLVGLMKQISNNLRLVDELLVDIRKRVRKETRA